MAKPALHMNGTSQADLFNQYLNAVLAIEAAIDAVGQAAPHGRDYYTQTPEDWQEAREEHEGTLIDLERMRARYTALARHCMP